VARRAHRAGDHRRSRRATARRAALGRRRGALRPRRGSGVACFVDLDCCSVSVLEGPVADSMLHVKCPLCGRIFRARRPIRILQKVQRHLGMDHDEVSIMKRLRAFRTVAAVFDKRVVGWPTQNPNSNPGGIQVTCGTIVQSLRRRGACYVSSDGSYIVPWSCVHTLIE
jgi:hypothetical protein